MTELTGHSAKKTYRIFADFYDAYAGGFSDDLEFYRNICQPDDTLLEIGCGTGRILQILLQKNCQITGIDISEEMLETARKKLHTFIKNKSLRVLNHDFADYPLHGTYNKALLTFYTFNYILEKPVTFLTNIFDSLVNKSEIYLDLFYPHTLQRKDIDNQWIEKKLVIGSKPVVIRDKRTLHGNLEHRTQVFCSDQTETCIETTRRYYNPVELKGFLEKAGFRDIRFSVSYDTDWISECISENKLRTNYMVKAKKIDLYNG